MLRFMGENISEQEIRDIIEEADVDKDGLIDYSGANFLQKWRSHFSHIIRVVSKLDS